MVQKNEKRNQHYVPKCYLKNFSNNDKFITTFIHSKSRFIEKASLDSVAFREYLYGKDLVIEKMFGKLEGEWNKTFKIIANDEDVPDKKIGDVLYQIISFIAFQYSRTLKIFESQKSLGDFLKDYTYKNSASYDSAEQLLNRYLPKGYNVMEAPVNQGFVIIETLKELNLLLLENKSEFDFVTSDNPVALYNDFLVKRGYKSNYALGSMGICVLLPLTPKVCICLFDSKVYFPTNNDMVYSVSEENVKELNKLFCRNDYELIFFTKSHSQEYAIELDKSFVDKLESKTSVVESNIGPVILHSIPSILEEYDLPFLTIKKSTKKINVPILGPAPERY